MACRRPLLRPKAGGQGVHGQPTYTLPAEQGLQAIAQVLGDQVSLDHAISEIRYADPPFLPGSCADQFGQCR